MGRDHVRALAERLIAEGRSPLTPAVAVENAGQVAARAILATLATLADAVEAARLTGPVVLLIGEVAARADIALSEAVAEGRRA